MKKHLLTLLVLSSISLSVNAVGLPQPSAFDGRIQHIEYNANDVVLIHSLAGIGTQLVFSENEKILDIASGFSQGWEFIERDNILFLKPRSIKTGQGQEAMIIEPTVKEWDTNLLVTTNRRLYAFDLRLLSSTNSRVTANNKVTYRMQFQYPDDIIADQNRLASNEATKESLSAKPIPINWNYTMQLGENSQAIAPTMAYDDGRFTYLQFPNNKDFPVAFLVDPEGNERLIDHHLESSQGSDLKDILVLHRVNPQFNLRAGNLVVAIYNESFDANGIPPDGGTTVPQVKRIIKE